MTRIGAARAFVSSIVSTGTSWTWQAVKFTAKKAWDIFPYKETAHKTLEVSRKVLKTAAVVGSAKLVYKASQSEQLAAGISAAGEVLKPALRPVRERSVHRREVF